MISRLIEQGRIYILMWAILRSHHIGYCTPNSHFDALDGVEHKQAELAVEHIQPEDLVERCARVKAMRSVGKLKRDHIGRQSVVAHVSQVALCPDTVRYYQPAGHHERDEVRMGECRLVVSGATPSL